MKKNVIRIGIVTALLLAVCAVCVPKASADEVARRYRRPYGPPVVYRHHPPHYSGYYSGHHRPHVVPYRPHHGYRPVVVVEPPAVWVRPAVGIYF